MALKCKVRKTGESLAVTLPSQIAELHDICEGDYVEFTPIGTGEFRIKKLVAIALMLIYSTHSDLVGSRFCPTISGSTAFS